MSGVALKLFATLVVLAVVDQNGVTAMPHQCLEVYREVGMKMNIIKVLRGASHTAHNVNKALINIFDKFGNFFNKNSREILKDAMLATNDQAEKNRLKRMLTIADEVMQEFMARERRLYVSEAFNQRSKMKDNLIVEKKWSMNRKMYEMITFFSGFPERIRDAREMYKNLRLQLLEICDQSLTGFRSIIEAFRNVTLMRNKQPAAGQTTSNGQTKLQPHQEPNHRYTMDDKYQYGNDIEDLKEDLATKYFMREFDSRERKETTENLSTFVIGQLETMIKANNPSQKDINGFVETIETRFKLHVKQ